MLKVLMLRKKINNLQKEISEVREAKARAEATGEELKTREADLETAIGEANTEEERETVEEAIETFENDRTANEAVIAECDSKIESMEAEVETLEREIEELENAQKTVSEPEPQPETNEGNSQPTERKEHKMATFKTRTLNSMSFAEREALVARNDIQETLATVRSMLRREVANADYLINTTILGIVRANVMDYSKLLNRVNLVRRAGNGRVITQGVIPEAIWTECCASIKEVNFSFGKVELDCYKVAAFVPLCNAVIEDSDIDLLDEIIVGLNQALGYALDKAIIYGTGVKMPTGIVTSIASTANVQTLTAATGIEMYSGLITAGGKANGDYSRGSKTWVMNETTYTKLVANSLQIDAAGALVAGMSGRMPGVGGDIVVLNFIPDDNIVAGYFDLYTLQERAGWTYRISDEVRFVEDETLIKIRARYDGKPVIPTAFTVMGLGVAPTTSIAFAGQAEPETPTTPDTPSTEGEQAEG